jgi:hypothetical protein
MHRARFDVEELARLYAMSWAAGGREKTTTKDKR